MVEEMEEVEVEGVVVEKEDVVEVEVVVVVDIGKRCEFYVEKINQRILMMQVYR